MSRADSSRSRDFAPKLKPAPRFTGPVEVAPSRQVDDKGDVEDVEDDDEAPGRSCMLSPHHGPGGMAVDREASMLAHPFLIASFASLATS